MDTDAALRIRAFRLVTLGVSQKVIAAKMGMSPSTFSKWLNEQEGINPPSVRALDGFNKYVEQLCAEARSDPASPTEMERERVGAETLIAETEHEEQRKRRAATRKRRQKRSGKTIAGK